MNGKTCKWEHYEPGQFGESTYKTECGEAFSFTEGCVIENKAKYCQYCGGIIVSPEIDVPVLDDRYELIARKIELFGKYKALKKAQEETWELYLALTHLMLSACKYSADEGDKGLEAGKEMADVTIAVKHTLSQIYPDFLNSYNEKLDFVYSDHLPAIIKGAESAADDYECPY